MLLQDSAVGGLLLAIPEGGRRTRRVGVCSRYRGTAPVGNARPAICSRRALSRESALYVSRCSGRFDFVRRRRVRWPVRVLECGWTAGDSLVSCVAVRSSRDGLSALRNRLYRRGGLHAEGEVLVGYCVLVRPVSGLVRIKAVCRGRCTLTFGFGRTPHGSRTCRFPKWARFRDLAVNERSHTESDSLQKLRTRFSRWPTRVTDRVGVKCGSVVQSH